jgi:hypothetical protein
MSTKPPPGIQAQKLDRLPKAVAEHNVRNDANPTLNVGHHAEKTANEHGHSGGPKPEAAVQPLALEGEELTAELSATVSACTHGASCRIKDHVHSKRALTGYALRQKIKKKGEKKDPRTKPKRKRYLKCLVGIGCPLMGEHSHTVEEVMTLEKLRLAPHTREEWEAEGVKTAERLDVLGLDITALRSRPLSASAQTFVPASMQADLEGMGFGPECEEYSESEDDSECSSSLPELEDIPEIPEDESQLVQEKQSMPAAIDTRKVIDCPLTDSSVPINLDEIQYTEGNTRHVALFHSVNLTESRTLLGVEFCWRTFVRGGKSLLGRSFLASYELHEAFNEDFDETCAEQDTYVDKASPHVFRWFWQDANDRRVEFDERVVSYFGNMYTAYTTAEVYRPLVEAVLSCDTLVKLTPVLGRDGCGLSKVTELRTQDLIAKYVLALKTNGLKLNRRLLENTTTHILNQLVLRRLKYECNRVTIAPPKTEVVFQNGGPLSIASLLAPRLRYALLMRSFGRSSGPTTH